jgi:hypothetical protein
MGKATAMPAMAIAADNRMLARLNTTPPINALRMSVSGAYRL